MMKEFRLIWLIFVLFLVGCGGKPEIPVIPYERISVEEAEELVRAWMFDRNPDMNPAAEFPLEDVTAEEVWRQLGGQIFKLKDPFVGFDLVLILDGRIIILGNGVDPENMCITDLNEDGEAELLYTYSWGSGILRSGIAIFSPSWSEEVFGDISHEHGYLTLEKIDDQTVYLYGARFNSSNDMPGLGSPVYLGQIVLKEIGGEMILSVIDEEGDVILEEIPGLLEDITESEEEE